MPRRRRYNLVVVKPEDSTRPYVGIDVIDEHGRRRQAVPLKVWDRMVDRMAPWHPDLSRSTEIRRNLLGPDDKQQLGMFWAERRDWLDTFTCFIPKCIREPWLGDLREDLQRMRADGRSETFIRRAAVIQIMLLFLNSIKERLLSILEGVARRA
jgi:hypothetical protein